MRLPLWDAQVEAPRRWLFHCLACFEDEANPRAPNGGRPGATVSARRLFVYLGLGDTPFEGCQNLLGLLLPKTADDGGEDQVDSSEVLVHDVWKVLFSAQARPRYAASPPRELEPFCRELVPPPPPPEPAPVKKGQPPPTPPEPIPPPPPEEVLVSRDNRTLLRHAAVVRALCTHGALLCRKRSLRALFQPVRGDSAGDDEDVAPPPLLRNAAEASVARALASMVPIPPTPEPPEGGGSSPEPP